MMRRRRSRSAERCSDRTRSTARRCAIVATHAIGLPLPASNRDAARQTSTKTSWVTSRTAPGRAPHGGPCRRRGRRPGRRPLRRQPGHPGHQGKQARQVHAGRAAVPWLRGGDTRPGPLSTPLIRRRAGGRLGRAGSRRSARAVRPWPMRRRGGVPNTRCEAGPAGSGPGHLPAGRCADRPEPRRGETMRTAAVDSSAGPERSSGRGHRGPRAGSRWLRLQHLRGGGCRR